MWTRKLLKENAKIAFQRNYWTCVLVCAVSSFLGGAVTTFMGNTNANTTTNDTELLYDSEKLAALINQIDLQILVIGLLAALLGVVVAACIAIFVTNVLVVGSNRYFLENREHKANLTKLFYGFSEGRYWKNVGVLALRMLYIWGWSLLFVIPGIVKTYSYMLVPYILAENTYMDRGRVFELSREMMRGHKWEAFKLELSFLGWFLVSSLTGGIVGIVYVNPYWSATFAEFYTAIKAEAKVKGLYTSEELPGVSIQTENIFF